MYDLIKYITITAIIGVVILHPQPVIRTLRVMVDAFTGIFDLSK
jgi:hypothetical protein